MKNKQTQELAVCGRSSVLALLEKRPEAVSRFFFRQDAMSLFRPYLRDMAERHTLYRVVTDAELERLSKTPHHQGSVAMIDFPKTPEPEAETVRHWLENKEHLLILDGLGNDHNLGAIVRSAAFFGVRTIVLAGPASSNLVTTSAYRVAEGGMEWVSLYRVPDVGFLSRLAGPGLPILGADHRGPESLRSALYPAPKSQALALALGNEETGLSAAAKASCSKLVRIPGMGTIESLNVAQTAAILLYELAGVE